jgi:hypothetical protein
LQKGGANTVFLDSGADSAGNLLITKNCLWDANGFGSYGAWVYRVGRFVQINCSVVSNEDPRQGNSFSTEAIMVTCDRLRKLRRNNYLSGARLFGT